MRVIHKVTNGYARVVGVELTRRNLEILLAKLDMPNSQRTIERGRVRVTAVENVEHYTERQPGDMLVGDTII